jgi:hypothetical protein
LTFYKRTAIFCSLVDFKGRFVKILTRLIFFNWLLCGCGGSQEQGRDTPAIAIAVVFELPNGESEKWELAMKLPKALDNPEGVTQLTQAIYSALLVCENAGDQIGVSLLFEGGELRAATPSRNNLGSRCLANEIQVKGLSILYARSAEVALEIRIMADGSTP